MKTSRTGAAVAAAAVGAWGCVPHDTHVRVESFLNPAQTRILSEAFDEGVYRTDGRGRWDIVLHSARPGQADPSQTIVQTLHLRLFWQPRPGTSGVEPSQTNAVLCWYIWSGATAMVYEGAGFVYFDEPRPGGAIRGRIESGLVVPTRKAGDAVDQLGRCRVTGRFQARADVGRTAELTAEASRRTATARKIERDG